eukprot:s3191_g5.t2
MQDLTRGMQCLNCAGTHYPLEDGSWSCCETCGDATPSSAKVAEAESFWQAALQGLDTADEPQYRELAVQLHRRLQGLGLWPRARQHWVAAWAARAAAAVHQGFFPPGCPEKARGAELWPGDSCSKAASSIWVVSLLEILKDGKVRHVRGRSLVALHAEALAFRARAAQGLAEKRGSMRAGRVAKIHAERGLQEAEPILGMRHPLVRSLERLRSGLSEAPDETATSGHLGSLAHCTLQLRLPRWMAGQRL